MNDKAVNWLSRPLAIELGNRAKVLAMFGGIPAVDNGTRVWIAVSLALLIGLTKVKAMIREFVCDNVKSCHGTRSVAKYFLACHGDRLQYQSLGFRLVAHWKPHPDKQ